MAQSLKVIGKACNCGEKQDSLRREGWAGVPRGRRRLPADVPRYLLRPALECGDREQRHHSRKDIVKIEIAILPDPLTDHRVINLAILVEDEKPPREEKKCGSSWRDVKSVMAAHPHTAGTGTPGPPARPLT